MIKLNKSIQIVFLALVLTNCQTDNQTNMDTINKYIEAINSANVDKICDFLANDHLFIDSQDNRFIGVENLRAGWTQYFEMFPDYKIEIEKLWKMTQLSVYFDMQVEHIKTLKIERIVISGGFLLHGER